MTPAPGTAYVTRDEHLALAARYAQLEQLVIKYMMKHRELAAIEMGFVEDAFQLERTKESRHKRVGG